VQHTSPQDIVCTVTDPNGAYAFFADETGALTYAAKVHGQIGPCMTRAQAYELVQRVYEARFGSLSHHPVGGVHGF
jgi:hypothetical protein